MVTTLVERIRAGDRRALARLITAVERGGQGAAQVLEAVHPYTGQAYVIGITGPPGAGKSTLVDGLTARCRAQGFQVGILAVDPTSPFSGGAFLGDRIRMQRHYLDKGVFIRSMATRGAVGGLPRMTMGAIRVLDASGRDVVMVETVGVGQAELEVMSVADTVVVVLVPEAGDAIQTLKAGLTEIADIFVVNKADREGSGRLVAELEAMLGLAQKPSWWRPPVLSTQAHLGTGLDQLHEAIQRHRAAQEQASRLAEKRRQRHRREFIQALQDGVGDLLRQWERWSSGGLAEILARVESGQQDPYVAARQVLGSGSLVREWLQVLDRGRNA